MIPQQHPLFPDFIAAVAARLEKGREAYNDQSFSRPPGELVGEIKEELVDVCGWAFVLWCRLRDLEQRLAERITAAYLPDQQREDLNDRRRADQQDNQGDDASLRIAMLDEAIDNAPCADGDSDHHGHGDHAESEPAGLRVEIVQSHHLWPVRGRGTR